MKQNTLNDWLKNNQNRYQSRNCPATINWNRFEIL